MDNWSNFGFWKCNLTSDIMHLNTVGKRSEQKNMKNYTSLFSSIKRLWLILLWDTFFLRYSTVHEHLKKEQKINFIQPKKNHNFLSPRCPRVYSGVWLRAVRDNKCDPNGRFPKHSRAAIYIITQNVNAGKGKWSAYNCPNTTNKINKKIMVNQDCFLQFWYDCNHP